MVRITADLIRKKSEHNEGTMAELEEISLHQLEIERIENIDRLCPRVQILYLQNNIINKMENLGHLKELQYLNMALNNVNVVQGLRSCEFLGKLDLTVNFVDVDKLQVSIDNLTENHHLKELYLVGNPCCDWDGYRDYVIARLPQLEKLDGKEITRSMKILASQRFNGLADQLVRLAAAKKREKAERRRSKASRVVEVGDDVAEGTVEDVSTDEEDDDGVEDGKIANDATCEHSPEVRTQIYREMAEEKQEKEDREKANLPKERKWDEEHRQAVDVAMSDVRFSDGRIRQCNDGKLQFRMDDDSKHVYLYVEIPRFVDTSLVECDVQPEYLTVVVKNKVLRLVVPDEVMPDSAKCERSSTTGELKVTMPKVNPSTVLMASGNNRATDAKNETQDPRSKKLVSKPKLGEELLAASVSAMDLRTMYRGKENPNLGQGGDVVGMVQDQARAVESQLNVPPLE